MTNGSLMKVESILGAFCNTVDLHLAIICLESNFGLLLSDCLRQVSLFISYLAVNSIYIKTIKSDINH